MIPFHDQVGPPEHCRCCWLYHNEDAYNRLWGGPGLTARVPGSRPRRDLSKPRVSIADLAAKKRH